MGIIQTALQECREDYTARRPNSTTQQGLNKVHKEPCSSQIVRGTRCDQDDVWVEPSVIRFHQARSGFPGRGHSVCKGWRRWRDVEECSRSSEWSCVAGGSKTRGGANSAGNLEDLKDKSVVKNVRTVIAEFGRDKRSSCDDSHQETERSVFRGFGPQRSGRKPSLWACCYSCSWKCWVPCDFPFQMVMEGLQRVQSRTQMIAGVEPADLPVGEKEGGAKLFIIWIN